MKRIQRNHVTVGTDVRVTWTVNALEFAAVGTVEEKPHRFNEGSRVRLKIALHGPSEIEREVFILDPEGNTTSLQVRAGIGWDGWLVLPDDAKYFSIDS